jgi:predicted porin
MAFARPEIDNHPRRLTMTRLPFIAAALALCPALACAQDAVTIYGRLGQFATSLKSGASPETKSFVDHGSRLGFMGREDLGGGMRALFGLEMGLSVDDGTMTTPPYRHSYVGLSGTGWGTIALGRLDSGTAVGSPIYSQVGRIVEFVGYDAGSTSIGTSITNARNRTSNSIGYMSPTFNGVTIMARGYLRGAGTATESESSARSLDLGVEYRSGPLYAGVSVGKDERSGGLRDNEFDSKWQAGARYSLGAITPYVLLGRDSYNNTATTRGDVGYWLVGAVWTGSQHKAVLNVMQRDVQANRVGERKRWQAAYTYALSKRTEVQAFADQDGVDSSRSNVKIKALGLGMRHVF